MKGILKQILAIAAVLGICGGIVWYFQNENSKKIENDESYKMVTSRDKSYNGVYTLTKLDKNGKNTWNGLIMYVKNDKIISCVLFESETFEHIRKKYLKGDTLISDEDLINYSQLEPGGRINRVTGFDVQPDGGIGADSINKIVYVGKAGFVYYDEEINFMTDYDNLNKMGLIAGYDEKSNEIWLSKVIKNKYSQYKKGYKLIHYKDYWDMKKNCRIDSGICLNNLNHLFNANLETND